MVLYLFQNLIRVLIFRIYHLLSELNKPRVAHGYRPLYNLGNMLNQRLAIVPEVWGFLPALSIRPVAKVGMDPSLVPLFSLFNSLVCLC
jgi:hypothetical protein